MCISAEEFQDCKFKVIFNFVIFVSERRVHPNHLNHPPLAIPLNLCCHFSHASGLSKEMPLED